MTTVTKESLAARIAELEALPHLSLKEEFALEAFRMLLSRSDVVQWDCEFTQMGNGSSFNAKFSDEESALKAVKIHRNNGFIVTVTPLYKGEPL